MTLYNDLRTIACGYAKLLCNVSVAYVCMMITRVVFVAANYDVYADKIFIDGFADLLHGSLVFDTSTICYFNVLVVLLTLFPLHPKEVSHGYARVLKSFYVVLNSVAVLSNLPDVIYSRYTGRRTTASFFDEFGNDSNVLDVVLQEVVNSWWIILIGIALVFLLIKCYQNPLSGVTLAAASSRTTYYAASTILLAFSITFCVFGIRGGMTRDTRPITLSNANQYITQPAQATVILNTPFSVIRTLSHKPFTDPQYFTIEEAEKIFSPICSPDSSSLHFAEGKGKNVVVLIVESLSREYIGGYNKTFIGNDYQGYTPFIDSLLSQSMWCEQSFCNGRKSIDGMPSVLSSLPYFIEPFFLTTGALNHLDGLAVALKKDGYNTSFFHGAPNGSMGFEAFAKATGFDKYYGMTEYCQNPNFGGEADFDGHWAIWDEEFLQYFSQTLSTLPQPFMTSLFTASNHHPFRIPAQYTDVFPEEEMPINKCTRYTDMALRRFFEAASHEPWYQNTLFVICSDHVNMSQFAQYQTDLTMFAGPIIFFSPAQSPFRGCRHGLVQQIDVMPTVLNYLGHSHKYFAFGNDLLNTSPEETFAVSYINGFYQIATSEYFLQFDGQKTTAIYSLNDKYLEHNLLGKVDCQQDIEDKLKAIVEQYIYRMQTDQLRAE